MGDMISIPVEEYNRLLTAAEDLDDVRAHDSARTRLGSGAEELVPSMVVDRLLIGESPLRVWRNYRGLSQIALATTSGVNRVQIADIESGRKTGSVETVKKLAAALHVTIDDLI
jgi:DNA-binding XRE family transcriptional regulator